MATAASWVVSSQQLRRLTAVVWDLMSWFAAAVLLAGARYDFHLAHMQWKVTFLYSGLAGLLMVVLGYSFGLYRGHFRLGSFQEAARLALAAAIVTIVVGVVFIGAADTFPNGLALVVPPGALTLMAAGRWVVRAHYDRTPGPTETAEPTLIYGAGVIGGQLAHAIRGDRNATMRVVGLLDDDPALRNLHLDGGRVLGSGADLEQIAARHEVTTVVLAITYSDEDFIRSLTARADAAGLKLLVIPTIEEIIRGGYRVRLNQLHEVNVEDLLGRRPVHTDLGSIADYLSGKTVLITGAGGSIGSELARQVHKFGPRSLVLLDRDESGLHTTQLSIYGQGLLDTPDMVLADIRDAEVVDQVFALHRPQVVFHAAALKHLPMLEQYPAEGWKTNALGTLNMLEAARRHGVQRFVNISTDKAADATSVLGKTKRVAEELTAWFAADGAGAYLSVRFGNVLGSRGSMLHTFTTQIARGGPITVTHPDITRFFMTIPEACELVIQAGAIGTPGDVLVLDMGTPIRILDVARRLIAQSGRSIEIVYTGLRPGEKMHEVLFSQVEDCEPTAHPLISQVQVPPLDPDAVRGGQRAVADLGIMDLAGSTAPAGPLTASTCFDHVADRTVSGRTTLVGTPNPAAKPQTAPPPHGSPTAARPVANRPSTR